MSSSLSPAGEFYRALSLRERLASLRANDSSHCSIDDECAARRQQRWRAQPPFDSGDYLALRLALDGITDHEWDVLLGESTESLQGRIGATPAWLTMIWEAGESSGDGQRLCLPHADDNDAGRTLAFLEAVRPFLRMASARFQRAVAELSLSLANPPFDVGALWAIASPELHWQLAQMLNRAMILELNVARLQGELTGETSSERFEGFIERLRRRDVAADFLQEYPVLARQIVIAIDHWCEFRLEFLRHLCADWDTLLNFFQPSTDPGPLLHLSEAGDPHRGGRSVLIATFAGRFRLVYKPKSLAVDLHFQELIAWLNERGCEPELRPLSILDRGDHGWVEFVEARGCVAEDEVCRFFERQGAQLALLHVLRATDFHSENLIAAGEHPVLVDLEALFNPDVPEPAPDGPGQPAQSFLDRSVLRTGLLPERIWTGAGSEGIDISGLGAEQEQQTPFGVPRWESAGTDEMRVVFRQVTIPGGANRVQLNGRSIEVTDYVDAVATGFTRAYRLLQLHRNELLATDGPLARFVGNDVRVIVRPTTTYCVLMRESFHPDLLRDGLDRDQLFDMLWTRVPERPCLARVIQAEQQDLWQGDIPLFSTRPESRDLWTSSGERIDGFFEESGLSLVRRGLEQMGNADLERQVWIVRASLATLSPTLQKRKAAVRRPPQASGTVDREQLLSAACDVGRRLETLALRDAHGVSWIGLTAIDERRCSLELLGLDLYDGMPGVIFFLAYLGAVTGEARWSELARAAQNSLMNQIAAREAGIATVGAFNGWGGLIYLATHLAALWSDPTLLAAAHSWALKIPSLLEQDHEFDIVSGTAGGLAAVVALFRVAPSPDLLEVAKQCGNRLLAQAVPAGSGIGWPATLPARGPLTGFSHGTAGIAWTLLELSLLTGEQRFAEAARDAVAYERGLYSSEQANWPDLRDPDPEEGVQPGADSFVTAWCHGAPGIGMARLQSLRHVDDARARAEIDAALQTTLTQGFGGNHCLCHGDLGNLELFVLAADILRAPQHRTAAEQIAAGILRDIRERGWITGVPQGVESPGLMTGLAGIGYGWLRLADSTRVPSLLSLAPPAQEGLHAG